MTPKEKAEELVNNFYQPFYYNDSLSSKRIIYARAKQCALIAVDEILAMIGGKWKLHEQRNIWNEVKKEIEKL